MTKPTVMDMLFAGMLVLPWLPSATARGTFFLFYTAFLFTVSLAISQKRTYKSLPLALFLVWSIVGLFVHSYFIYPNSVSDFYRNFCIMAEGFLYILFGTIFIQTIVRYATNLRFAYFLIPLSLLPWLNRSIYYGKSTQIVAIGVSIVIYLFLSRRWKIAWISLGLGLAGVIAKWSWLCMKFRCRPYVWLQMTINSFYHPIRRDVENILDPGITFSPWFDKFFDGHLAHVKPWLASVFGSGFSPYLNTDYIWVSHKNFGWVCRQNDFLHLMECAGVIGLGLIVWYVVECLKTIGVRPVLVLFVSVLLVCFCQLTMFSIGTGGVCLTIMTFVLTDGIIKREELR